MFSYIWPIALVVLSNVVYQICAKSTPHDIDPLASLTVTYAVGAIASIVQSSFLAVALLLVGFFLYHEALTASKAAGILICMIGLYFINR
jgi:drug/metabolite transporter (DMT)-like permease